MIRKQSVVLTALAFFAVSPAYALDFDALLNTVLGNTNTFNLSDQASLKTTINERQAQLEQELEAGTRSGYLTVQEQQEIRNQLNHAAFMEGSYLSDGNLSRTEVRSMVDELGQISRRMQVYLSNSATTGFAADSSRPGNRWGNYNDRFRGRAHRGDDQVRNQTAIQAGIDTRQAAIDSSISVGLRNGQLSAREARRFRDTLNRINADEVRFLADARLSYSEEQDLTNALTRLEADIRAEIATNPRWGGRGRGRERQSVTSYGSYIRTRIEAGVRSGKLSRAEARKLYTMEENIRKTEAALRNNNMGSLALAQQNVLLNRLDTLDAQITSELNDRDVW